MIAYILLAVTGMTLIVSRGTIFRPLQKFWSPFFGCSQCVGMWVGAAAGTIGLVSTGRGILIDAIVLGAAGSVSSMLADALLLKLLGDPNE